MSRTGPQRTPGEKPLDEKTLAEAVIDRARIVHDELTQLGAGPEWTLERVVKVLAAHQQGEGPPLGWFVKPAEGEPGRLAIHYYYGDELIVRGRSFR